MLTLFLIRHAKSSWDFPALSDKDRPLNKRGRKDAPLMGKILAEKNEIPDLIISSPAVRAFSTAKAVANETGYKEKNIIVNEMLYMAGTSDFIEVIGSNDNKKKKLMIISHNYGITDFANEISGSNIENIPTCGTVKINFDFNEWRNIADTKGKMEYFIFPKMYK